MHDLPPKVAELPFRKSRRGTTPDGPLFSVPLPVEHGTGLGELHCKRSQFPRLPTCAWANLLPRRLRAGAALSTFPRNAGSGRFAPSPAVACGMADSCVGAGAAGDFGHGCHAHAGL